MGNLLPSFQSIANADYISLMLLGFVNHKDDPEGKREEARLYRRAIVRYINLAIIETLRTVSLRTAKRFRTYDDLVACSEFKFMPGSGQPKEFRPKPKEGNPKSSISAESQNC